MTVPELHAYAESRAIEIDGKLKLKADILAAIKHAEEDII